jgi:carbon monoxide dehydrogenase subunit G
VATYRTTVSSPKPPAEVFDYLAEFSNAATWDPGVVEGEMASPGPVGPGSRFRLVAAFLGRRIPLEYRITAFERPARVVLQADDGMVRSTDEITVAPADGGSRVTYEAELRLAGPFGRVVDPVLGLVFRRIGDRAAAGLRATLAA